MRWVVFNEGKLPSKSTGEVERFVTVEPGVAAAFPRDMAAGIRGMGRAAPAFMARLFGYRVETVGD